MIVTARNIILCFTVYILSPEDFTVYLVLVTMMLQIQKGYMCVEGDNKENSRDSREYGAVPMGLADGKVVFRVSVVQLCNGLFPLSDSHSDSNSDSDSFPMQK